MTSARRQQLGVFGSLNRNPMYIGNVQFAVEGRLSVLIMAQLSIGNLQGPAYSKPPVNA